MEEIKSVRVRVKSIFSESGARGDYKVTIFNRKRKFRVDVFQGLGPGSLRKTGSTEYSSERRSKLSMGELVNNFINDGINTLIRKPVSQQDGTPISFIRIGIEIKIIQDPWLEEPPKERIFGSDPYYLNNGSAIFIDWSERGIWAGGDKWSDFNGNELNVSRNNDSKFFIDRKVEIWSPDTLKIIQSDKNEIFIVTNLGIKNRGGGNEPKLYSGSGLLDTNIIEDVLSMWNSQVPNYNVSLCDPDNEFCELINYISPLDDENLPDGENLPDEEEDNVIPEESKTPKEKLSVVLPSGINVKVKEDISIKIYVGDPPITELPTVDGFDFGDEEDFSDLLLDDEFREDEFAGLDESQLEIQEYPDERTRIETQNQAQLINNQPYVPGKYNLDIIPGTFLGNNKENITCCNIDGKPVNIKIADAVLDMKASAKKDGINLIVTSGFRPGFNPSINTKSQSGVKITAQSQEELYQQNCVGKARCSPATASAGRSKHGNGIAVDFNTGSRTGKIRSKLNNDVYSWLVKNSWRFGFVRTVASEEWHFEYWADKSKSGPYAVLPKSNNLFYSDLGLNNLQIA